MGTHSRGHEIDRSCSKEKKPDQQVGFSFEYLRPESNRHALRHTILSRARLPIPPLRQTGCKYDQTLKPHQITIQ